MRRQPEFDRFHAGLSKRVDKWIKSWHEDDAEEQDLVNAVRSELSRTWKYLIERINKHEQELSTLRARLKDADEVIGFYADRDSWFSSEVSEGQTEIGLYDEESITYEVDNGDFSTDLFGGKRAREYMSKYKEQND